MICYEGNFGLFDLVYLLNDLVRYDHFGHNLSIMYGIKNKIPLDYEYISEHWFVKFSHLISKAMRYYEAEEPGSWQDHASKLLSAPIVYNLYTDKKV